MVKVFKLYLVAYVEISCPHFSFKLVCNITKDRKTLN